MSAAYRLLKALSIFVLLPFSVFAQADPSGLTITDVPHYSNVFGEIRNFRIFLPPGYQGNPSKRYPVIYFFHGWSQRYFGDGGEAYASFDKGEDNNGDNIGNYVSKHDVIVVKWDGYNRSSDEEYYKRPYNVSPVETFRQFPIYFTELVKYIDDHYKTIPDRANRGVSGLSMGGFMTYWIAAKYPHMVTAAGSFCGSPEFEVGPRTFPSEYRHIDMYKNFDGVNVRLNYGDKDFIRGYHEDMNRIWPQLMDNYQFKIYDAEHSTAGMAEMFDFILNTFKNPPAKPATWHHTDVYPNFSVWDYDITSNRNNTGFTVLENVNKRGLKTAVRSFVPDGEILSNVEVTIRTAPIYEKNQVYTVNDNDLTSGKAIQRMVQSDINGRLSITVNGNVHDIGINKKSDQPNISIISETIENAGWITQGKEAKVEIKLLNKGMATARNVQATISAFRNNVKFSNNTTTFGDISVNAQQQSTAAFSFIVNDTSDIVKLKLDIKDGNKNQWSEFLVFPVRKNVAPFKDVQIADGRILSVANAGTDVQTMMLGKGNGDGIPNPGESIILLVKDSNRYWRTQLLFSDPFINAKGVHVRRADNWTNFDHVGASAKYDVPLIAADCPQDRTVEFLAEYWTPQYPHHIIKQGTISINIKGTDKTAPGIQSIMIQGDNTIEAKIIDGSELKLVKARLILKDDPSVIIDAELKNDGTLGDRVANDHVYSFKIPEQKFGLYRVIIEATDSFNNTTIIESERQFEVR